MRAAAVDVVSGGIRVVGRTSPERRCVYCRGGAGDLRACDRCGATLHADCRAELGRCSTLGCQGLPVVGPRSAPLAVTAELVRPVWVTLAGHALIMLVTTVAAAWLAVLLLTSHISWLEAHGFRVALIACPAAGFPVALLFSLPWLLGARQRVARTRGLALAPRPRAARLEVQRPLVEVYYRNQRHMVERPVLVLTEGSGRASRWELAKTTLPEWALQLEEQEVTLYGETDDPMLVELRDGRLLLLFRQ